MQNEHSLRGKSRAVYIHRDKSFLSAHAVTIVPSLAAAREEFAAAAFDVALVDYDLDDGKGDEIVKEIRRQNHAFRIVATSSHEVGNNLLLQAGADAVCSKMNFKNIAQFLLGD